MLPLWKKASITTKFATGFGVFLLLLVMIAITGYYSLDSVHNAERTIRISAGVQELVLEMERGMEKARRLHSDFFLYYPLIGFTKAYDLYAHPSALKINKVLQDSARLKEMLKDPHIYTALQNNHIDLNLYVSSARRFAQTSAESIALIRELAAPKDGLETLFRQYTAALEKEIETHSSLNELFDEMASFSKDYLINRQRSSMQSSFNVFTQLKGAITKDPSLSDEEKRTALGLLAKWKETAEKILSVDVDLKSKFTDFSLQTEATEPASTTLIRLAKEDVALAQKNISRAHKSALIIMAVITATGLLLAIAMAKLLNRTITENIISLTRSAESFQQGNLDSTAHGEGPDELGRLAQTFNTMAAKIRELVNTLEQKVEERTVELSESEKRFRAIVENTTQGILIADGKTTEFLYANPAITTMLGYENSENILGKKLADIHPEGSRKQMRDDFAAMIEGKIRMVSDIPCTKKDGTTFFADIVTGKVNFAGRTCLVGFFMDTTEKRNLQAQLERARKMEAIGLLAGGVAHDLNNILSGIVSYPELILLQLPPESGFRRPLEAIHESGKRAAAVVSDLLTVARGVASPKETTDLNSLIAEYFSSPEHLDIQSSHVRITCRKIFDPCLTLISCSSIHIKKCLLNLMLNAMEAIDDEGVITIATQNLQLDESKAEITGLPPGLYAVLTFSDTGHGIKEQDLEHIFEPFYTKKAMGKSGTGLGLAVVWNTMHDHGGTITVKSSEKGTTFHLYFPKTDQPLQSKNGQMPMDKLRGNKESILVIDDEAQQLDIAGRILNTLNYDAHCVQSGEEAVAYLAKNRVDLILLDMIMSPGLSGLDTFKRIIELHPNQKAVIVSGFAASEEVRMVQILGARGFLKKPYSIQELGESVKEELQSKKISFQ